MREEIKPLKNKLLAVELKLKGIIFVIKCSITREIKNKIKKYYIL